MIIDTHSHLHFPEYDQDREACLTRMQEKGIGSIVIGTTLGTSASAIRFAEQYPQVWASVGYHPEHFSSSFVYQGEEDKDEYSIEKLRALARSSPKVVAIGETGLDFYRIDEGMDIIEAKHKQEQGFREQLQLAAELDKTLVVHARDAFPDLVRVIGTEREKGIAPRVVIHCFTGSWQDAQPLLKLGCWLSFSGIITFPAKKTQDPEQAVQRVIERMPWEKILAETDAPFLAPVPYRGQRNEPAYVEEVIKKIAEIKAKDRQATEDQLLRNTQQAFSLT